jgi:hypothetical protein
MKIRSQQLNELIRLITRGVLKEYSSMMSSSDDSGDSGTADDGVKPTDAKTAYEKSKEEREQRKKQQDTVRTAQMDLDSTKKQQTYFKAQAKQNEPAIQAKTKKLQQLKGAPPSMIPAGGTIAENIRRLTS